MHEAKKKFRNIIRERTLILYEPCYVLLVNGIIIAAAGFIV
jgi:hypothetical protein